MGQVMAKSEVSDLSIPPHAVHGRFLPSLLERDGQRAIGKLGLGNVAIDQCVWE